MDDDLAKLPGRDTPVDLGDVTGLAHAYLDALNALRDSERWGSAAESRAGLWADVLVLAYVGLRADAALADTDPDDHVHLACARYQRADGAAARHLERVLAGAFTDTRVATPAPAWRSAPLTDLHTALTRLAGGGSFTSTGPADREHYEPPAVLSAPGVRPLTQPAEEVPADAPARPVEERILPGTLGCPLCYSPVTRTFRGGEDDGWRCEEHGAVIAVFHDGDTWQPGTGN